MVRRTSPIHHRFYEVTDQELEEGELIQIDRAHLGCTMMSAAALAAVTFRFEKHGAEWEFDDYCVCDDLRALGIPLYCDTTVQVFHMCDGGTQQRVSAYLHE